MRSLKCKLPIEIYYNGEGDLRQENIDMLRALEGVRVIDLKPFFKPGKGDIGGWAIKPFAMLFSSFQEMIFIDSDALFFQDPAFIFDWKSYKDSGMIVFRDRTIGAGDLSVLKFFKAMVPDPSDYAKSNRFWKELSVHEGESGVVVVDKSRAGFYILLMAQNMNSPPYQKKLYKAIHGDKESFWMAAEALGVTYAWAPGGGGTVGYPHPEKKNSVCGGLFHVDEDYAPLWFNGGLIKNKHADEGHEPMQLTHFAIDRTFKNLNWYVSPNGFVVNYTY